MKTITSWGAREAHPRWNGGRTRRVNGYIAVLAPDHPRASRGYVYEHILVAEHALGKHLPDGAQVHHLNGDRADNRPANLVVCQDQAYHSLLHRRQRALAACGRAHWRCCGYCKQYDDPALLRHHGGRTSHDSCHNAYRRRPRHGVNA